jgi:hypothetical protein
MRKENGKLKEIKRSQNTNETEARDGCNKSF